MKPVIGAAALGVLALGGVALATSYHRSSSSLAPPVEAAAPAAVADSSQTDLVNSYAQPELPGAAALIPAATTVTTVAPVPTHVVYRDRVVYRTARVRRRHTRSGKHSAMIIGGSTVGGAGLGALVGGKKGALVGAVVGGTAGTIYDRKTRHNRE